MKMNELQQEWDRTKAALMAKADTVFFTTILFSLKFEWDERIPTAATNGRYLKWNPKFFLSADREQRMFVATHEAYHVALDHMGRALGKNMRVWTAAADHFINLDLKKRGFKMWDWVLCDPRFTDMGADQIYQILMDEKDDAENRMDDLVMPGDEPGDPSMEEHRRHIEEVVMRAAIQAKASGVPGAVPGSVELFLQRLMKPKLPWTSILRREVMEKAKVMYTWMRPNKRYQDIILPSLGGYAPMNLTFYVDISGSVSDHQFHVFVSEMAGALKMCKLESFTIVQFDTSIKSIDRVTSLAELKNVKFTGRGGTHIECILKHMDKHKPQLACVFTDGFFGWPRQAMKTKVLWLINDNEGFEPEFGRALHFKTTGE